MRISFRDWYECNISEVVRDFSKLPVVDIGVIPNNLEFRDDEAASRCVKTLGVLGILKISKEAVKRCVSEKRKIFDKIPNGGYWSNFDINGDSYVFNCYRSYGQLFNGHELDGVFSVEFRGPNSYKLTKSHSASHANMVYSHVISSVLRSMEMERSLGGEVNGFVFDAFDRDMGIVYDYFYKIYLKPSGYLRVDSNLYLNRGYLKKLMSGATDMNKRDFLKGVLNGRKTDQFDKLRRDKGMERKLGYYVNKIILAKRKYFPFLCFVRKLGMDMEDNFYLDVLRLNGDDISRDMIYVSEILGDRVDSSEALRFIELLRRDKYFAVSHQILDGLSSNLMNSPTLK